MTDRSPLLARRSLLAMLATSAAAGVASACRARPAEAADIIRQWFALQQLTPPNDADVAAIQAYFARRGAIRPEATLQPAVLFNPDVFLD